MAETLTNLQEQAMMEIEKHGKENPITGRDLANRIGLKPRQTGKEGADMRSIINALRMKGYPICASGGGYWWPKSRMELSAYIASFEGRVLQQERALSGLKVGFSKVGMEIAQQIYAERPAYFDIGNSVMRVPMGKVEEFLKKYPLARRI